MIKKIFFLLIFCLAVFFRFYLLGSHPNAYTPDELAQGYTAYSLLTTGKDEWGSRNWINLRSFGDYKPPLQTWLMIPSIKVLGLTPFAVRLPNAILSVLSIVGIYFLAKHLFSDKNLGYLSAVLLAFSTWHIPISRIALEADIIVFLLVFGTLFYLLAKQKPFFSILSSLFFGLTPFTYHSAKVFIPLYILLLFIIGPVTRNVKNFILFFSLAILLFSANFYSNSLIKTSRTGDIAIFKPTDKWSYVSDSQYESINSGLNRQTSRFFNNKLSYIGDTFIKNYLSYFSPQFFTTNGAGETTYGMLPGFGVAGLVGSLGLIYSVYSFATVKKWLYKKAFIFLSLSLLLSPIAASLAKGSFSANRTSVMIPFLILIIALGLKELFINISKFKFGYLLIITISGFYLFETASFLQKYFYQGNQILSQGMLFGHKQAMEYLRSLNQKYDVIYSRKLSEPQAYVMFFDKVDPHVVQSTSSSWLNYEKENKSFLDQLGEYKLLNYTFREINFASDSKLPNTILVGKPEEFPPNAGQFVIYYPYFSKQVPAVYIYQNIGDNK